MAVRVRALRRLTYAGRLTEAGQLCELPDAVAEHFTKLGAVERVRDAVRTSAPSPAALASAPSGEQSATEDAAPQPTQTSKRKKRKGSSSS